MVKQVHAVASLLGVPLSKDSKYGFRVWSDLFEVNTRLQVARPYEFFEAFDGRSCLGQRHERALREHHCVFVIGNSVE